MCVLDTLIHYFSIPVKYKFSEGLKLFLKIDSKDVKLKDSRLKMQKNILKN